LEDSNEFRPVLRILTIFYNILTDAKDFGPLNTVSNDFGPMQLIRTIL